MKCNCSCGCGEQTTAEVSKCPVCSKDGVAVPNSAVQNLIKTEKKHLLKDGVNYYLCMDSECPVSYYDKSGTSVFNTGDIKVELWYKTSCKNKIACYCNNITFEQVREQVIKNNKVSWNDIVKSYRKTPISKCSILNPAGNCCFEIFYGVINDTLKEIGKEPVEYSACC